MTVSCFDGLLEQIGDVILKEDSNFKPIYLVRLTKYKIFLVVYFRQYDVLAFY